MVFGRNDWPYSLRRVTARAPSGILAPRLVKIWITPLAASEPYSDEAAAPLMISTWSMSSELMSAREWRVGRPLTSIGGPDWSRGGLCAAPRAPLLPQAAGPRRPGVACLP